MVARNTHMAKLKAGYLFPEINKRKRAFLEQCPEAKLVSLGIGDTTQPLEKHITYSLTQASFGLGTQEGYSGYGPEQGQPILRERIAEKIYHNRVHSDDIFISDGSKCDIGRLQMMFGSEVSIAVQNPTYPVYVDTSMMMGQQEIVYMPCLPENGYFPNLSEIPRTDLIYFCSPNNPTGATATREQLEQLVAFARKNDSILIFDAAYSLYVQDPSIPKSIYEIAGADEVAIEMGSFSKMAGFTGVRLGWTVVPAKLEFADGSLVKRDWDRVVSTCFNGASNISQLGGIGALDELGMEEMKSMVAGYLGNARRLRELFVELGYPVVGGDNAPYVWVDFGRPSWEVFDELLREAWVVCTPGSGFGSAGEGFMRFSAFGSEKGTEEAIGRLRRHLSGKREREEAGLKG